MVSKAHSGGGAMGTVAQLDRLPSSELGVGDSISQQSRPGQPPTPDQILPFHHATSLHSSAGGRWPVDSLEVSASPAKSSKDNEQQPRAAGRRKQPITRPNQGTVAAARPCKRRTADLKTTPRLSNLGPASPDIHPSRAVHSRPQAAAAKQEDSMAPAADTADTLAGAVTEISQSAADDGGHCCDSMASALAPLMQAHVRSKPALPAEVTDDSEAPSKSSSDKAQQLSLAELRALFGVPLTEAAARLGVQRQDLVRSCRRHNLKGWPRRCISVTEAARSEEGSMPMSSLSNPDASELAAFMPFGALAQRASTVASQADSVHTRSSSRVGGSRVHAFGACAHHKGAAGLEEPSGHGFRAGQEQQATRWGGRVGSTLPAEAAARQELVSSKGPSVHTLSLLPGPISQGGPSIELDRPGMWAPRILQARAQAEEATSAPGSQRSRAAQAAPVAGAPLQPTVAASPAAAVPSAGTPPPPAAGEAGHAADAAEELDQAAAAVTAVWLADPSSRTTETLCQHKTASMAEQDGSAFALSQQQAAGAEPGSQPVRCMAASSQPLLQIQAGVARPQEPAAELTAQPGSAPVVQPAPGVMHICRQPCVQPAVSAPLQGCRRPSDVRKKLAGMRRTLSAPHMDAASEPCLIEVTSPALRPAGCADNADAHSAASSLSGPDEQQQPQAEPAAKDLAVIGLTAARGAAAASWGGMGNTVQADSACPVGVQPTQGSPTPVKPSPPLPDEAPATDAASCKRQHQTIETPPAAEQARADMLIGKKRPGSRKRAKAAGQAAQAGGGQRPGKRRGRPAGSGKTAQAKAADLAQAVAGLESKRPLKKSRKAIEAEEALCSLLQEEAALSGSPKAQEAQPKQSLNEAHSTDQGIILHTPTSKQTSAARGSCEVAASDVAGLLGKDDKGMECHERLLDHLSGAQQALDAFLNLSPPPALPGITFAESVCHSLLGSPLPRIDSPQYHQMFYGDALNDLSLGAFNDIADSFGFGSPNS